MNKMKLLLAASIMTLGSLGSMAQADIAKDPYLEFEHAEQLPYTIADSNAYHVDFSQSSAGAYVVKGFEGISQYDVASVGRSFIPPDTMGAVGTTQYTSFVNGGFAVYDKSTGSRSLFQSDLAFWAAAGQTGANGDSRVLFNSSANRWVALSFGSSVSDIQIAVSNSSDALGGWTSTKFTGFAGGTADYPTLAMDKNAIYIGTNNFNSGGTFSGTTLNVIPIASIFGMGPPSIAGLTQYSTPYANGGADGGFAIQGVNSNSASSIGHILAASLTTNDVIGYDVNFVNGVATSKSAVKYVGTADYADNGAGRQPNAVPDAPTAGSAFTSNNRVIDTGDQRIGSSVYEVNGKIYAVYTATPVGSDFTSVHYVVVDATTKQLISQGDIGDGVHDFYQASLAVNANGQVLIAYNRSGAGSDGKVSILAQAYNTDANGNLVKNGTEQLLKVSLVDDYHNGALNGFVASGRQRWGDYSSVSLDPSDSQSFWVIGEYAREYNDAAGGHPGGTGGSRWSTWISQVSIAAVPEPSTWLMMLCGFGMVGVGMRRKRPSVRTTVSV
ncbi:PEPxxWA-CTERM sorting domain-containing protein [Sphingomonas sp. GB1N7]